MNKANNLIIILSVFISLLRCTSPRETPTSISAAVHQWNFDYSADDSGNAGTKWHGTASNISYSYEEKKAGTHSAYFNGNDGFVSLGIVDFTNIFTIAAWIKPDTDKMSGSVISNYKSSYPGFLLMIFDDDFTSPYTHKIANLIKPLDFIGEERKYSTSTVPSGEWTHAVWIINMNSNPGSYMFYINGILSGSGTDLNVGDPNRETCIGSTINIDELYKGYIDDLRYYDSELDEDTITILAAQ
jgi:hypothetical protein